MNDKQLHTANAEYLTLNYDEFEIVILGGIHVHQADHMIVSPNRLFLQFVLRKS